MRPRPLDLLILAAAAGLTALSAFAAYAPGGGEPVLVVSAGGEEYLYPLGQDRHVEAPGPLGLTEIDIVAGRVVFAHSPCPNQTCVASGEIHREGQWLACLPNEVFARIEGGTDDGGVDAAAY